ncbi:hypothetical protein BDV32DRAFT_119755 [Aspergillus pseudonomiae]|uniref:Uncharacterized protein n=1 Tax=Aspergillus pseudonomiae TaxID=1506151 RepID=A0A5N6IA41_9EURO|nr:uncharacterized protein BDV37DRAFT_243470 [Aspergillus pseudonomiae]KAB8262927.1 hypothetical protein BDV32DRAFT_119755 [Aspergillus pseudonomiae]KAE8406229.1 hypothetical protein BDV37DRAFT_243470 [Aspergillus pseudonomiae]
MAPLRSTYAGVTLDAEKTLLCKCGYPMKRYTVRDAKSPYCGEQYLACRRHSNDEEHCKSWIWFDETPQVEQLVPRLAVPQTPKKQTDIREFGQLTPPKSSCLKRKRVNVDPGRLDELPGDEIEDSDLSEGTLDSPSRSRQRMLGKDESTPVARSLFVRQEGMGTVRHQPLQRLGTSPHRVGDSSTPQNPRLLSSGLFTPGSGRGHRKRWIGMDAPATPTKQNHIFASPACVLDHDTNDSDSYGWDEELVAAMLDKSDQVQPST